MLFSNNMRRITSEVVLVMVINVFCSQKALSAVDPTKPPGTIKLHQSVAFTPLILSMIVDSKRGRKAVINETVVSVSDTISQARVMDINSESVILLRNGKRIELRMPFSDLKKSIRNE